MIIILGRSYTYTYVSYSTSTYHVWPDEQKLSSHIHIRYTWDYSALAVLAINVVWAELEFVWSFFLSSSELNERII